MNDIDIYYESIKQVFEQINNWEKPKPPLLERIVDGILTFAVVLFITSLIPIIPILCVIIGGYLDLSLFTITFKNASIIDLIKIWGGLVVITLLFMALWIWINAKVDSIGKDPVRPPQILSPEQLTFIAVYESYKELKIFFVSHIEQHVDNSYKALRRVLPIHNSMYSEILIRRRELLTIDENYFMKTSSTGEFKYRWEDSQLSTQIRVASSFFNTFEKYAWFQLDSHTKSILQALISFTEKIPSRLIDKQDLPRVLSVLENYSKFIYAYLPEHNTYMDKTELNDLQTEGAQCLDMFTLQINELTTYTKKEPPNDIQHENVPSIWGKIKGKFYENVFFRFSIWFLLIMVLTSCAVIVINQQLSLSPDTMATVIIGTSVASAAALAGFLPVKPK
jgi:hypothetical protein